MSDRRVLKTKVCIKSALEEILKDKVFEQISVTELCERADVSRITFYAHYEDKFALVDEIFSEMLLWATDRYREKQRHTNPEEDVIKTFSNLIDSILDLYKEYNSILSVSTIEKNPYLHYAFFNHVTRSVEAVFLHRSDKLKLKYPIRQVSGFICNGLGGFVNGAKKIGFEKLSEEAKKVLSDILRSDIIAELT